jgi:hypothetical protein
MLQTREVGRNLTFAVDGQKITLSQSVLPSSAVPIVGGSQQKYTSVFGVCDHDAFTCARAQHERGLNTCVIMEAPLAPSASIKNTWGPEYAMEATALTAFSSSLYHLHQANSKDGGTIFASQVVVFRTSEDEGYRMLPRPFRISLCSSPYAVDPALTKRHTTGIGNRWRFTPQGEQGARELVRTAFRKALRHGADGLVLPALGCGPLHNHPPGHVSEIVAAVLKETEFRDRFREVLISIPHVPAIPHHPTLPRNHLQLKKARHGGGSEGGMAGDYEERNDETLTVYECFERCFGQVGLDGTVMTAPQLPKTMSTYDQAVCMMEKLTYR